MQDTGWSFRVEHVPYPKDRRGLSTALQGASSSHPLLFELYLTVLLAESLPASPLFTRHSNYKDENCNTQFHSKLFQMLRAHFSQVHSFSEHLSSRETVFKAVFAQTMGFTSSAEGLSLSADCSSCLDQLLTGTHTCVAKVATVKHQGLGSESDSCPAYSETHDVSSKSIRTSRG